MSATPATPGEPTAYPATLNVDYPDRPRNRLTSFFRVFTIIPIAIIIGLLAGAYAGSGTEERWSWEYSSVGFVFLPLILMILFRQKYPRWWFDWNLALTRFGYRVIFYFLLLRDEYPATDEEQAIHIDMPYPDVPNQLGRGMPLIKWLLAVPHGIVLCFLWAAACICVIAAWFAILFTRRYPKGLFDFVVGVSRWSFRVEAYAFLLITDRYPPFSLEQ